MFFVVKGPPGWQGRVTCQVAEGCYLVQLFSWVSGEPTESKLLHISEVTREWSWFSDSDAWVKFGSRTFK